MRLPLLVFSSGQSYGLVWDIKRGFSCPRFVSDRRAAERIERMKTETTDIAIEKQRAPTECWVRKGDAIVDVGNSRTALDFVAALKNQSAAAWVAVKTIVVNPVLNEKNIKAIIREKRFEEDEVFGIFLERMIVKGKLDELQDADKVVSFMQQCVRNQVKLCISEKAKKRAERLVLLEDCLTASCNADTKEKTNPIDTIPEDETKVATRSNRLMEDEKAIVRRCFVDFWRKHPRHAYVLNLRNMGLSDKEIKVLIGERTDNNVTQLARRGGKILADQITAKKIPLPGMTLATSARKRGRKHG